MLGRSCIRCAEKPHVGTWWYDSYVAKEETNDILLEVSGPDARPSTVDPAKVLEFGASYLALLTKMAGDEETPISFAGLFIIEKCFAFRMVANDPASVRILSSEAAGYVRGRKYPHGLGEHVVRVQEALRLFPHGYEATVINGPWKQRLRVPDAENVQAPPYSIETIRATVLRVGGLRATVRLKPVLEQHTFTAFVEREQAKELAKHLYCDVDIVIRAARTDDGNIDADTCRIVEFTRVTDDDPADAMRKWFKPYAEYWDKVEDVEQELRGRDRSH